MAGKGPDQGSPGTRGGSGTPSDWDARRDGLCALPLRVRRAVPWHHDTERDVVQIRLERWDRISVHRSGIRPYLEALEEATSLPDLVDRVAAGKGGTSRKAVAGTAYKLVSTLRDQGNVEVVLPPVPEVFDGRFHRVGELGRGAIGVAWLCRDAQRDQAPTVVKHAWNWSGPLEAREARIAAEADVLARLDHPCVLDLRATFEVDGRTHLARDHLDGTELATWVHQEGPPGPSVRKALLTELAGGLAHLHDRGVLHLDLSPDNVMVASEDGRPVLFDLDHAELAIGQAAELAGPRGTAAYAAPEVLDPPHAVTPRSDVYGLGRLACFLATGRTPAPRASLDELVEALEARGGTRGERELVEACCQREPDDRPPDPLAAADHLG